jgi:hypothetical protein
LDPLILVEVKRGAVVEDFKQQESILVHYIAEEEVEVDLRERGKLSGKDVECDVLHVVTGNNVYMQWR